MINHSGHFDRVGGPGFFFPSLAEAAQAVEVDASRLPNARSGSHYIPASVLGGGRNDAGRVSFHPKSRSKRSRYSSENDVLIEKSVKYTDFFLLSIVYV